MQLSRIGKWDVLLLVLCALVGVLAGCGDKVPTPTEAPTESVPPEDVTEDLSTLAQIETDFGTLYIPQKYEQLLQIEVSGSTVKFSARQDGTTYALFDLAVGEEAGQLAGTLTDKRGTPRDVYITVCDLGDISNLSQDKQDQLYAAQEAVNVVVENLK